jgi:hypothetical protein
LQVHSVPRHHDLDSPPSHSSQISPHTTSLRTRRRKHLSTRRPVHGQEDTNIPPPNPIAWFEKEMLSELTCEICFMLLYQPVTTPCQHVSLSLFARFLLSPQVHIDFLCQMPLPLTRSQ